MANCGSEPKVVVFFDINVSHKFKRVLESAGDGMEVVFLEHKLGREEDYNVLKHFERLAREKYPKSAAFLLTHDGNFEKDSLFDPESPVFIIKIPLSSSEGKILTKDALGVLVGFFSLLLSSPRPLKFSGWLSVK